MRALGSTRPYAIDGRQPGAHQLPFELHIAAVCFGKHKTPGCRPSEKRYLIHRRVEWRCIRMLAMDARGFACEACEAADKLSRENIQIVGPSVMKQIPDHLHLLAARRLNHRNPGRPVVVAGAINDGPAQAIARRAHSGLPQAAVILLAEYVVLQGRRHIQPVTAGIDVTGTFEPTHPKRAK